MLIVDKKTKHHTKLRIKNCKFCNIEFATHRNNRKMCSKKCASLFTGSLKTKEKNFTCKFCFKKFRTTFRNNRQRAYYCSTECKKQTKKLNLPDGEYYSYDGYIVLSSLPDGRKQVKKHRYIMECFLKRKLLSTEIVHHIDENKLNNDIKNLMVVSREEHNKIHFSKK